MENCTDFVFPIILYILVSILVIVLIVFVIRLIKTLGKVDRVMDDVSNKASKLNGIFNIIDNTTDAFSILNDKLVDFVVNGITKIFRKRKIKKGGTKSE